MPELLYHDEFKDGVRVKRVIEAVQEDDFEMSLMRIRFGVRPILMFPANTPTDRRYANGTAWALEQVRQWWRTQTGVTFSLMRPYIHRTHLNANEIVGQHLVPIFNTAMEECGNPGMRNVIYYMVAVYDGDALGGGNYAGTQFVTKGRWWNRTVWAADGPACDFTYPARSWLSKTHAHVLAGIDPKDKGYQTTDPNAPLYVDDPREFLWNTACGGMAHELAHCFGVPDGGPTTLDRIMFAKGHWPYAGFTHAEIQLLRKNPFLR